MSIGTLAGTVGRGLLAGLIGTVAITASQMVEMKLRDRGPSTTPADAAGEVLGVEPKSEEDKLRFANLVHFGYGTAWGAFRGLLGALGIEGNAATALHFAAVSGTAMTMLPSLGVAPPVTEQPADEVASSSVHHLVYALAAGWAFDALQESARKARRL